ncbi:DNA mismatch repair protein, C-terminal,DNA mismatch repair protein family,DNA mismatch repair [Cinara cedri]|uniref:DNA mismatch repair protein, C-terminal,DNA mismatch repair protein family,DNA mismatch repair n=1 Tax=Cinara cedri TaxID=506608 RepID=A0A5E4M7C3_9HEMI|nr:DNA mismatch repair protein, C-terminal,DNA mismatch repair protein family,DNA mismatch repair [Cinara cedri]
MSGQIKPINKLDVHKICSGQVVLNLATAVKELIENSLDAGATSVELRLKEFGKDSLEVTDNGAGIHPDNFEGLALKHHTSKIQDFADLSSVETFGFRGEALSSLCALSNVTVTTRHSSQECGTKLLFDHEGNIKFKVPIAKQVGTAVNLSNLFSSLPVRHKEFHRNLKKEFGKMIQVVTGYCLVATQVKMSCTNQTKSTNNVLLSTHGSNTVLENISCIYGSKQANSLLILKKVIPENDDNDMAYMFELDGYVSSCDHSSGRSSKDRQFYFINSRPCEPLKVVRAVNEVYHQYNQSQYPFVYLNITIARDEVDINVTPDKRQIFLSNENYLVSLVKASLNKLYENIPSTYKINTLLYDSISTKRPCESSTESMECKQIKLDVSNEYESKEYKSKETFISHSDQIKAKLNKWKSNSSKADVVNTMDKFLKKEVESIYNEQNDNENVEENKVSNIKIIETNDKEQITIEVEQESLKVEEKQIRPSINNLDSHDIELTFVDHSNYKKDAIVDQEYDLENVTEKSDNKENLNMHSKHEEKSIYNIKNMKFNYSSSKIETEMIEIDTSQAPENRKCVVVETSIKQIRQRLKILSSQIPEKQKMKTRFYATIDPNKNQQAESELSREISKDMFSQMTIVGQFNLGFIITKLDADLFIVDQHASDEKYNFETLQKTTKITSQKLVVPQQLELTAINEMILMDNIDIFKMNGFDFEFQPNAQTTKKIKLTMIPMSNNWRFGKEDVDELLFMLQDAPNTLCRPSRVRSMFASRACRKSVMIGSVLNMNDMRKLIDHMGVIEQPWNCPHGRPTMRHLLNLSLLLNEDIK